MMNNMMTDLLNIIEDRLGTDELNLPEKLKKDQWGKIIKRHTLSTFSSYFPRKIRYVLGPENKKNDYWLIDETICNNVKIIGVGDIDWHAWSSHYPGLLYGGVNSYDMMTSGVDFETMVDVQMMADHVSAFTNGIYLDYEPPNIIRLNIVIASSFLTNFQRIPINLFVEHAPNLMTIEPTKMETFKDLATADIASWLFEKLKMYDGLNTVSSTIDLKLASLEQKAARREEIVERLKNSFVSAANRNMPVLITIN